MFEHSHLMPFEYPYPKGALRLDEILALPVPSIVFTVIPDESTWWGKTFVLENVKQLKLDEKPIWIGSGYSLHFEGGGGIHANTDGVIDWLPTGDIKYGFLFKNPWLAIVYFNSVRNRK